MGVPDCEPGIRLAGFEFRPVAATRFPPGTRRKIEARLSKLHGMEGLRFTLERLVEGFEAVLREAPPLLRSAKAEAFVADEVLAGSGLAATLAGIPFIHVANALPVGQYDCVPPGVFGWSHWPGVFGRLRNRFGYAVLRFLLRRFRNAVLDAYHKAGVAIDAADPNSAFSTLARIAQIPAVFDFPNPQLPPWFHHAGPFHDRGARAEADFPWNRLTGEPLIYASMGTVQNGSEQVFRTIAKACAGLGCQVAMSLGEHVAPGGIGALAGNVVAVNYAPQLELLQRATLCITHAGMNTALESLSAGIPMVAIPVTNDQPGVAARIRYTETGLVVPYKKLTAGRLRRAVTRVLEDAQYRSNALKLQTAIRQADGLNRAADLIEAALGMPKPSAAS